MDAEMAKGEKRGDRENKNDSADAPSVGAITLTGALLQCGARKTDKSGKRS